MTERVFSKQGCEAVIEFDDGTVWECVLYQTDEHGIIYRGIGTFKSLYAPWGHVVRLEHDHPTLATREAQ